MVDGIAERIHVLHVMPGLGPGGIEMALGRIVRGLSDGDMQHSIVCLTGEAEIRDQIPPSAEIHCMHAKPNELLLPWRLRRLLRRIRPTVIHARNWSAWPDIALARLLLWHKVPLIISFHGFDSARAMPLRRRIATRLVAATASRVFTVTEASRRLMIEHIGLPADRVEVIPNGVDVEKFKPGPPPDAQSRVIVGTVGSLSPVKNHALLIRACALARRAGADVELRIAGEGPERAMLTDLVDSTHLEGHAQLLGHQTDVPAFLNSLDIFVLSSRSEAHPNALLEAMACGLPCIGTRVGGLPEVLGFGRYGRLVEPDDAEDLSRAITELARNPAARKMLGQAARAQVLDRYSMDHMLEAYSLLYREPAVVRHLPPPDTKGMAGQGPRVLMLGPLPPLLGGMATVVDNLSRSPLTGKCRLATINNGKTTPRDRSCLVGVAAQVRLLGRVLAGARRLHAQIAHIHTCALFSFWRDILHMLAFRLIGCRVIWHIHDGSFEGFVRDQPRVRKAILQWALRKGSRAIVLSRMAKESLEPLVPGVRWHVLPNGVAIPPVTGKSPDGSTRFLFLGNLTRRKGAYDLVAATARAKQQGFTGSVHLAGGEGTPGDREAIERFIAASGCQAEVRLLGIVRGEAKENALASSDCLVLPSYAEGLPMAVLEAMAYGLPVIATRIGAVPEAVTDGQEGFLIDVGDIEALADRLLRIAADADVRRRMGAAARRRAEAEFSLNVMVDRILSIYDEVLER